MAGREAPTPTRRFVKVYRDDPVLALDPRTVGAYIALRLTADALWPAPVAVPRAVDDAMLDALVATGSIVLAGADQFRVPDIDRERVAAYEKAQAAALTRWESIATSNATSSAPSNARDDAQPMLSRARGETQTQTLDIDRERTLMSVEPLAPAPARGGGPRTRVTGFTRLGE